MDHNPNELSDFLGDEEVWIGPRSTPVVPPDVTVFDTLFPEEQERWLKRRGMCGQFIGRHIEIEDKFQWKQTPCFCGLHHDGFCHRCEGRQQEYVRWRAKNALEKVIEEESELVLLKDDADVITEICRRIGKDNYQRIPLKSGKVVLLAVAEKVSSFEVEERQSVEDLERLDELDWREFANTPPGKNLSGNLGKPEPVPLEEGEAELVIPEIYVAPNPSNPGIEAVAVSRALELIPDDLRICDQESAQRFVEELTTTIATFIVEGGGKLLNWGTRSTRRRMKISRIWLNIVEAKRQLSTYPKQYFDESGVPIPF